MEIIPDRETYRNTVDAAANNFDQLGVEVSKPEKATFGYTPEGKACYCPLKDMVYIGPELTSEASDQQLLVYEHENVHYEQFRRTLGEPDEELHGVVRDIQDRALSKALDTFDNRETVDAVTYDQHLNFYNMKSMVGLASAHEEFLETIEILEQPVSERPEFFPETDIDEDAKSGEIPYNLLAERVEEVADDFWKEIKGGQEIGDLSPLLNRYNADFEDDLMEAQAQFWQIFRIGALDDLPETKGVYPESLDSTLDKLEVYEGKRFYENGENVEEATREQIEEFRDRKHSEERPDHEIAAEMLNKGLDKLDHRRKVAAAD